MSPVAVLKATELLEELHELGKHSELCPERVLAPDRARDELVRAPATALKEAV